MAALKSKKLIRRGKDFWQERQRLIILLGLLAFLAAVLSPAGSPGGFGIKADKSKTTTTELDAKGQAIKTVTAIKEESGKTAWDWLSLLGVPLTLTGLGLWFQQRQQERQAEETKRQQERADDEAKEEILQVYYDRLSALLVDKNLLAIAAKKKAREAAKKNAAAEGVKPEASEGSDAKPEEEEVLDSALDVIRARTLSILRRFEDDKERKNSVIRFLLEADFISKLELNLSGAELSGADFFQASLIGANLSGANLFGADLYRANLIGADLSCADLRGANLSCAELSGAALNGAELNGADIGGAKLRAGSKAIGTR